MSGMTTGESIHASIEYLSRCAQEVNHLLEALKDLIREEFERVGDRLPFSPAGKWQAVGSRR